MIIKLDTGYLMIIIGDCQWDLMGRRKFNLLQFLLQGKTWFDGVD
jgi:uncharacterized membrane protein YuzA (DUF378 family)